MRKHTKRLLAALTAAALPLAVSGAIADAAKKGVTEAEIKYQAARLRWPASRCTRTSTRRPRR